MTGSTAPAGKEAPANIYVEPRKRLVEWVRRQLVGPHRAAADGSVLVGVLPTERFPCGALYPTSQWGEGIDPATEDLDDVKAIVDPSGENTTEPAVVRRYIPPSSLGFSFFIKGERIQLQVRCGACEYVPAAPRKNHWMRKRLISSQGMDEDLEEVAGPAKLSESGTSQRQSFHKLAGKARVDVLWRPFDDGWIVTVSLCNTQEISEGLTSGDYIFERAGLTLFEARLRCVIAAGDVGVYPRVDRSLLDEEEQEIAVQYAHRHVYAVGHGCAAEWTVQGGAVIEIGSDTMPAVEVPQMTADTGATGEAALSLARLAKIDQTQATLLPALSVFVDGYLGWVANQKDSLSGLPADDHEAAQRIVARMYTAVARMRAGLRLLSTNAHALLAFALANRAMLDQMRQHDKSQGRHPGDDAYRWRPFQLAFLLTTLESTENADSDFRDTVDLIWFPTGGGKTEAYLGLIAFQILLRRLRHTDSGGGTCVLMRYTLRLLARDQFVRAVRLICALELIRRERQDLGVERISIGMWVGEATSPNTFTKAAELLAKATHSGNTLALVIDHCPWCGDPFAARRNYRASATVFHFLCRHSACDFGVVRDDVLPCNVVDEALYAQPPTLLVATVDKFARLAWEEKANAFFGGAKHRPPELIIQDELHLIAGALGSMAGLYEAALDTVVQCRGIYPKYIASTATIRMAEQQVKRLYGRQLAVFPPPGLSCDDSYFARVVPLAQRPGRLYVGYLAPMLNRRRSMAPLAAALLVAPQHLFQDDPDAKELLDAWWTQMVYHGSLKGVSNSHTAFLSDVGDFMQILSAATGGPKEQRSASLAQLTSLQTAEQNSDIFARLRKTRDQEGSLDAVLATNMVSVGLDVARLALMTVNGQPLTTAEYIQASSRVGRSDVPGVVFANYYRDQARSLSHYESFRPYHEAFYRFVEPTSVTPYTYQARTRALHAALVIVMRHIGLGLLENDAAAKLNPDNPRVANAIQRLKVRFKQAAGDQAAEVAQHLETLVVAWHGEVERCRESRRQLSYHVSDREKNGERLLCNHSDQIRGLWPTLQSLRNVESTALLKVL